MSDKLTKLRSASVSHADGTERQKTADFQESNMNHEKNESYLPPEVPLSTQAGPEPSQSHNNFTINEYPNGARRSTVDPEKADLVCCKPDKKDCIMGIQFFVVLALVGSYFGYELSEYLNPNTNRKDYTKSDTVDEMPIPFIYMDFVSNSSGVPGPDGMLQDECFPHVLYWNHSYDGYLNITSEWKEMAFLESDQTLQTILSTTTKYAPGFYRSKTYISDQYLYIPADNATIDPGAKDWIEIRLICPEDVILATELWYEIDHKEQLNNFDNASALFTNYYWKSDYIYKDYAVKFTYEWFSFDNEVDDTILYDYFIDTVESTFAIDDGEFANEYTRGVIEVAPNGAGKKTTFVTTRSLDVWAIFSLTGGMFTSVNTIVAAISIYLIWGFDFKFFKFSGVAKNADPSQIERRRMEAFIDRTIENFVGKEVDQCKEEIKQLKKLNKKLLKHLGLYKSHKKNKKSSSRNYQLCARISCLIFLSFVFCLSCFVFWHFWCFFVFWFII